tara:strand:+ start:7376 stop:7642 length:267 start_codon:yes stop_codon:yes gene_type:complete
MKVALCFSGQDWNKIPQIKNSVIYSYVPVGNIVIDESGVFLGCSAKTPFIQELDFLQTSRQFKIYTGVGFSSQYNKDNFEQILAETSS